MSTISLALYTVRVRHARKSEFNKLNSFDGKSDLLNVMHTMLTTLKTKISSDVSNKKALQVLRLEKNDRTISGVVRVGDYGEPKEIYDIETHELVHSQKANHVPLAPFYFQFYLPSGTDLGIVAFQRYRNYGVRTITAQLLRQIFRSIFEDYILVIAPLAPRDVIDQYIKGNGRITQVRLL